MSAPCPQPNGVTVCRYVQDCHAMSTKCVVFTGSDEKPVSVQLGMHTMWHDVRFTDIGDTGHSEEATPPRQKLHRERDIPGSWPHGVEFVKAGQLTTG